MNIESNEINLPVTVDATPVPDTPEAIEAIEHAMIDVQVATARRFPRKMEQFRRKALDMMTGDVETAESCWYMRPVGVEFVDGRKVAKYAEGPSIRAAEIVAAAYGNIRAKSFRVQRTPEYVVAEGQCWDMETNYAASVQAAESLLKKDGKPVSERQAVVIEKALLAKVYRDAIFKVVPRALFKAVMEEAKRVAEKASKSLEERRKAAAAWLATLKLPNVEQRACAVLGVSGWSEVGTKELTVLSGIRNSIRDGEVTIDEAFPEPTEPAAQNALPKEAPAKTQSVPPPATKLAKAVAELRRAQETPAAESGEASYQEKESAAVEPVPPAENPKLAKPVAMPTVPVPAEPEEDLPPQDALPVLTTMINNSGVPMQQVINYLKDVKIMKKEQKHISELSAAKLNQIIRNWEKVAEVLRHQNQNAIPE